MSRAREREAAGAAPTHALRAVEELRARILSGRLPGGARLYEAATAEDLAISRTPVREAMSRLAEEGLLERARGGGFLVRRFAPQDALDAIELRGALEGVAARLAAERGAAPDRLAAIAALVAALDACFDGADGVDFDGYARLNDRFHAALWALAGSDVLERELVRATRLPFAAPSAFLPDRARAAAFHRSLVTAQAQHRALVEAIERRQGARAEALAREHAQAARANLERALAGDGGAGAPAAALVSADRRGGP